MKKVFKFIISFICYLLFIPSVLIALFGAAWYVLPALQTTFVGEFLIANLTTQGIFAIVIAALGCSVLFGLVGKLTTVIKSSKALNFYTHLITWLSAICLAGFSIFAFLASETIYTSELALGLVRKIGIMVCASALLIYAIVAPKVRKLVDRRIQAYDTAKELNTKGRSSVIGMQILKCLDFICPEIFLLAALCFAFNWAIALYFLFIIAVFILPLLGNIVCDYRARKEIKRKEKEKQEATIQATAQAVSELLQPENGEDN